MPSTPRWTSNWTICIGLVFAVTACRTSAGYNAANTPPQSPDVIRYEILATLDSSAHAWNSGDLDGFIASYDPQISTTFVGRESILRGPAAIRAVYAPRFAPGGVRDSLSFENVEVDVLAPDAVSVLAFYRLMRGDSTTARGPTSLVMRRRGGGWRIVHDHSS